MKSDKGITMITLIIYVILIMFVIIGMSTVTASFYKNIDEYDEDSENALAFSKFNMYFINDIKKRNVKVTDIGDDFIVLSYEKEIDNDKKIEDDRIDVTNTETVHIQYTIQNESLYRDKVKICDKVYDSKISYDRLTKVIDVHLLIGEYEKDTQYVVEKFGVEDKEIEIEF